MSPAKMAEPMQFEMMSQVGLKNHVLDECTLALSGEYDLNRPSAAMMQPYVKLL